MTRPTGGEFPEVLEAARAGAGWALTALYRDIHPGLLRYLEAHAPGEAEDLASDIWIDVARGLCTFSGGSDDLRRYVFTIARRRVIDLARKRARRRTDPTGSAAHMDRADPSQTEELVLARISGEEAARLIRRLLSPEQADIVLLRVVGGLSVAQVAEITGRRPGAVSLIQHRALRRLARRLEEAGLSAAPSLTEGLAAPENGRT